MSEPREKIRFDFEHHQNRFDTEGVVYVKMLIDENRADWRIDNYESIPSEEANTVYEYPLPSTNILAEIVVEFHYYRDYIANMNKVTPNFCFTRCVKISNYDRKILFNIVLWDVNQDDTYFPDLAITVPNFEG